jgi:hypothetical protein
VRREVERAVHKQLIMLPFRIEEVLPSKSLEYFLSAQHWMDAFPAPREPYYGRLCSYVKAQLAVPAAVSSANALPGSALPISTHHFDDATLLRIERRLAEYIGPLAKHLVKRAALEAGSLEDLVARLASELDRDADRHHFTKGWKAIHD